MKVQATTQNKIGQFVWSLARTLLVHKRYVRKLTTLNVPADVLEFNKGMVCEAHNTFFAAKKHFVEDLVKMTYPDFEDAVLMSVSPSELERYYGTPNLFAIYKNEYR